MSVEVQITPLVGSDDRPHVLSRYCWCEPAVLPKWWPDQDVVVHQGTHAVLVSDGQGAPDA